MLRTMHRLLARRREYSGVVHFVLDRKSNAEKDRNRADLVDVFRQWKGAYVTVKK